MTPSRRVRTAQELFRRLMPRLGGYREQLVIAGGIARDLYRYLPGFTDLRLVGATTRDLDIALDDPLALVDEQSLHTVLELAGMRIRTNDAFMADELFGIIPKPVSCRYFPAGLKRPAATDPHLEFISPQRPQEERNARPQGDCLIAYSLKYVDLLISAPVAVRVPRLGQVRIPHPLAYIVQKTLIRPERQGEGKQAKDQADAFQVLAGLRQAWASWNERALAWRRQGRHGDWLDQALRSWEALYANERSPGAREVAAAFPAFAPVAVVQVMGDLRSALA
jgi:hypothetical protein